MTEILAIDNNFPEKLKIFKPIPKSIYTKGNLKLISSKCKSVAIIGTRTPSEYGLKIAYKFGFELAKRNIIIISGMAKGIDSQAHRAAMDANGQTIAVLGSGIDFIYPPENKNLYQNLIKNNLIISEYPENTKPIPKYFLARNRIIAALADIVLVIEGKKRSGTISTANWAAQMGKEVYAVPGRIDSPNSEATNFLISEGAGIARSPEDILQNLN